MNQNFDGALSAITRVKHLDSVVILDILLCCRITAGTMGSVFLSKVADDTSKGQIFWYYLSSCGAENPFISSPSLAASKLWLDTA